MSPQGVFRGDADFSLSQFEIRATGVARMPPSPLIDQDVNAIDRRQFVRMMSAGGSAFFLGPFFDQLSSWFGGGSKYAFDLPGEWVEILGQPLKGYAAFIGGLQLKNFTVRQVIEPHLKMRGNVRCGLPPTAMWKRMKATLLVADEIATQLGEKPEVVISAYRSPAYNARCPGAASGSQHTRNTALDLQFPSSPKTVAAVAKELRAKGLFKGGVGLYSGFVHIDTRGTNATWG